MDEASQQAGSPACADQTTPAFAARDAAANAHRSAPPAAASTAHPSTRPQQVARHAQPSGNAHHDEATPTLSIRFAIHPDCTVTWKIASDTTLRVCRERIWLTRARAPYDHWLGPGDTLRLRRGERIWLSTDADSPAHVSLTSPWSRRRSAALHWIEWLAAWPAALAWRRAR